MIFWEKMTSDMIDIGQNDLTAAFMLRTYDGVVALIPYFMERIRDAMQFGGKKFWVHGTGPLGCLPTRLATRNASRSLGGLDKYGCDSDMNEAAKHFNQALDRLCQHLRFYVDVYSIKYDLIASSSSSYGFEHPLMACCGYGGPPYKRPPTPSSPPKYSPPTIPRRLSHSTSSAIQLFRHQLALGGIPFPAVNW